MIDAALVALPHRIATKLQPTPPPKALGLSDPCLIWTGSTDGRYGTVHYNGRSRKVHVVVYEIIVAEVPAGQELDHLCRRTLCARPTHVEPVTHRVNLSRGNGASHVAHRTGLCIRGHELAGENIYTNPNGRGIECRTCRNERSKAWRASKR